jgi:hypothetical protein
MATKRQTEADIALKNRPYREDTGGSRSVDFNRASSEDPAIIEIEREIKRRNRQWENATGPRKSEIAVELEVLNRQLDSVRDDERGARRFDVQRPEITQEQPPVNPPATQGAKEPWRMTRDEFLSDDGTLFHGTTSADKIRSGGFKKGWVHLSKNKEIADSYQAWDRGGNPETLAINYRPGNPAYFDADGLKYTDHKANLSYRINDAAYKAEKAGHDALVIKNIRDNYDSSVDAEPSTTIIVFDSEKLKPVGHKGHVQKALSEGKPVPPEVLKDYPDLTPQEQPAPKAKPSRNRGAQTIRGRIKEMGNIKVMNFAGELREAPVAVKMLTRKNSGVPLDSVEKSLKEEGWMRPDESLLDLLSNGESAKEFLKRRHLGNDLTQREGSQLTEQEKKIKQDMEWEPEEPPAGNYVRVKAEDLPMGKKLTILEDRSREGWDEYEIIEKDPFGVTLKDGAIIELSPLDEVDVRQEDMETGPSLELKQDKYGKQGRKVEGGIKSRRSSKKLNEDTYFSTPSNRDKAQGGIPFENPRKRDLFKSDVAKEDKRDYINSDEDTILSEPSSAYDFKAPKQAELPFGLPGNPPSQKIPRRVSTRMVTTGSISYDGNVVRDAADAAALLASIRKNAQENAYTVVVDDAGVVLEVHRYSKGIKNAGSIMPVEMAGRAMNVPGAAKVYFAHNHPSGQPSPSPEDANITNKVAQVLFLADIDLEGIVIGGGQWASITTKAVKDIRPTVRKTKIPVKERMLKLSREHQENKIIADGPDKIARVINELYNGEDGFVFLDSKMHVLGFLKTPVGKTTRGAAADIIKEAEATNAMGVVFNSVKPYNLQREKIVKGIASSKIGLQVFDVIEQGKSHQNQGKPIGGDDKSFGSILTDTKTLYSTKTPQQAAKEHGITYKGEQDSTGKPLHMFHDDVSGQTFTVPDLSRIPAELDKARGNADLRDKARENFQNITTKDVREMFKWAKGARVRRTDGAILVNAGRHTLRIKNVQNIAIDEAAFSVERGRKPSGGEMAAGSYQSGEIKISRIGDKWTIAHESFHWLEDIGVINRADVRAIERDMEKGDYKFDKDDSPAEKRAKWFEQAKQKRDTKGRLGRAIQKIQDFIDSIVNLFHRTARGVIRDVESGKILKRTGKESDGRLRYEKINEFAQSAKLSVKAAAKNIMDNPKFRKWFGDSKVVDEDGKPLVVYHATNSDFSIFDGRFAGQNTEGNATDFGLSQTSRMGHWFSDRDTSGQAMMDRVVPVYLSIENPYQTDLLALAYEIEENDGADALREKLEEDGYDGISLADQEFGGNSYVAFNPTQIKSIFNTEFDPSNPDIRYEKTAARWYSQMQTFLEKKLPGKASPAQLKQMLTSWANKGEFKQDELEWSGVIDWVSQQDGKVSKQDVINYLEQNNLRIEEVVKGGAIQKGLKKGSRVAYSDLAVTNFGDQIDQSLEGTVESVLPSGNAVFVVWDGSQDKKSVGVDNLVNISDFDETRSETKFSQYVLPGGSNYKELLIMMQTQRPELDNQIFNLQSKDMNVGLSESERAELDRLFELKQPESVYQSSHWDEPNVLAHVRFSERTVDGKRVLHIEEVQSDFGQSYRKELQNIENSVTNRFQEVVNNMVKIGILEEIC